MFIERGNQKDRRKYLTGTKSTQTSTRKENSTKRRKNKKETDKTERRNPDKKEKRDKAVKVRRESAGEENHPPFMEQLFGHTEIPSGTLLAGLEVWKMRDMLTNFR